MEAVQTFGLNPVLLIAQIVNFTILMLVLKRFLYKPLLKVLEERKTKIAQSLEKADEIEKRLALIESEHEERVKKSSAEAKRIIEGASQSSDQMIKEAKDKASEAAERIIEKAGATLNIEREKLYKELRVQIADLVAEGLEKVAGKTLTETDRNKLVEDSIRSFK